MTDQRMRVYVQKSVRLPPDLAQRLQDHCALTDRPSNTAIVALLEDALDRAERKREKKVSEG